MLFYKQDNPLEQTQLWEACVVSLNCNYFCKDTWCARYKTVFVHLLAFLTIMSELQHLKMLAFCPKQGFWADAFLQDRCGQSKILLFSQRMLCARQKRVLIDSFWLKDYLIYFCSDTWCARLIFKFPKLRNTFLWKFQNAVFWIIFLKTGRGHSKILLTFTEIYDAHDRKWFLWFV